MAKNTQAGAVIVTAKVAVQYEGTVLGVSKAGVSIATRDLGKQVSVERFFGRASIIAHTNEGEGFVIVWENRAIAAYHGGVIADSNVSVSLGDSREVVFYETAGSELRIDYDANDLPSSVNAKIAKRNTDKLGTAMRRMSEKSGGGSTKKTKKKKAK